MSNGTMEPPPKTPPRGYGDASHMGGDFPPKTPPRCPSAPSTSSGVDLSVWVVLGVLLVGALFFCAGSSL